MFSARAYLIPLFTLPNGCVDEGNLRKAITEVSLEMGRCDDHVRDICHRLFPNKPHCVSLTAFSRE